MLLQARNLTRLYGSGGTAVQALRDVSFEIEQGEFTAIMGPSGSGKSTLMSLIGLLDRPSSGRLGLSGEDVTKLSPDRLARLRNRSIGFVFQNYHLLPRITALENVELPLVYSGLPRRAREQKARAALSVVGLSHRVLHWPAQLSGGEQQRVAIARAIVTDPVMFLADEPTGALDSRTGLEILALFQLLHRAGRTIVLVTHDEHVALHASRILRLSDGELVADERVADPLHAASLLHAEPTDTSEAVA
jgi:putative ABC transport system ATP-binding protein